MKKVLALVALLVMIPALALSRPSAVRIAENTTVIVFADEHAWSYPDAPLDEPVDAWKLNAPICSGFLAYSKGNEAYVVTARHCATPDMQSYFGVPIGEIDLIPRTVHLFDGDVGTVQSIYVSPTDDVAVFKVHTMRSHPYAYMHEGVTRGEHLFNFGMPNGSVWSYSETIDMGGETMSNSVDPWKNTYEMSSPSSGPGSSGGPTFNQHGEVVGILVAGGGSSVLVVPSSIVKRTLLEAGSI